MSDNTSDFLGTGRRKTAVARVRINIGTGNITVNGRPYNSVMPALPLSDDEVASVLTYVNNSWGNKRGEVTPARVAEAR